MSIDREKINNLVRAIDILIGIDHFESLLDENSMEIYIQRAINLSSNQSMKRNSPKSAEKYPGNIKLKQRLVKVFSQIMNRTTGMMSESRKLIVSSGRDIKIISSMSSILVRVL